MSGISPELDYVRHADALDRRDLGVPSGKSIIDVEVPIHVRPSLTRNGEAPQINVDADDVLVSVRVYGTWELKIPFVEFNGTQSTSLGVVFLFCQGSLRHDRSLAVIESRQICKPHDLDTRFPNEGFGAIKAWNQDVGTAGTPQRTFYAPHRTKPKTATRYCFHRARHE